MIKHLKPALLASSLLLGLAPFARAAAKPNIVILFCDDLGYGDLGCYGNPTILTPNLDHMAETGMRFTQFYSASCVCSPSRASLLTGRYPMRTGTINVYFPNPTKGLDTKEILLPQILDKLGYATACIGKWHLGNAPQYLPTHRGFDFYYGIPYSNDMNLALDLPFAPNARLREGMTMARIRNFIRKGPKDRRPPPREVPLMEGTQVIEYPADQSTLTQRYTKQALAFINAHQHSPFFLYLPYTMPHVPLAASAAFRGRSLRGLYGDAVQEIDWSVGRILARLKETGLVKNTLVIFSSDNGPWLRMKENGGSAGLLYGGKFTTWEGGFRVPCIAWWPGKIKPTVTTELASTLDLFTTAIHLAGGQVPQDRVIDGLDIRGLLFRHAPSPRHDLAFYDQDRLQAYRYDRWKIHFRVQPALGGRPGPLLNPPRLYDLDADPSEKYNLAATHPDLLRRMIARAAPFQHITPGVGTQAASR